MICKNCKTAVENKSKKCSNCGYPVNDGNKWKIAAVALVATAIVSVFVLNNQEKSRPTTSPSEIYEPTETTPAGQQTPALSEVPTEALPPTSEANLEKPLDEVWAMLDEILDCINDYYDEYSQTVTYLSKNGHLYEDPSKAYVNVRDLEGLTNINDKYLEESIMFFYLRPSDLLEFSSLSVTESNELKIFVGYETRDGFAITARGEQGGIIAREELKIILDKYDWDNGEINKVAFDSDDFEKVIKAISTHTGNNNGFDIRHMYRDDKYISVVLSPTENPMQIKQFILEDSGDVINVKLSNIESLSRHKKAINDSFADFNQELLPPYDLSVSLKHLISNFTNVADAMQESNFIDDTDLPMTFSNGTSDFVYMEFKSGKRFIGHLQEGTWKMYPVMDDRTAKDLMLAMNRRAPIFIVKQY